MGHRVDNVVDPDADPHVGESLRITGGVEPLP